MKRPLTLLPILLLPLVGSCGPSADEVKPLTSGVDRSGFDESVRPQDDFNRWVNGGWLDSTEIPSDRQSWGAAQLLIEKSENDQLAILEETAARTDLEPGTDAQRVGDLFSSFLDTATLEELRATPIAGDLAALNAAESIDELVAENSRQSIDLVSSPVGLAIFPDFGDSSRYAVYLVQSGLTLPNRDYYLVDNDRFAEVRSELPRYAARLFELAEVDDPAGRAEAVARVETRLAEVQWSAQDNRDRQKIYNPMPMAEIVAIAPQVQWADFLGAQELPALESLVVMQPSYLEAYSELLGELDLETWRSYFLFRLVHAAAPLLSAEFDDANFDFTDRLIGGLEEKAPRTTRAVRVTNDLLGEAVGKVYVERTFPPEAKRRMEELVGNLISAFGVAIEELPWMTEETKARAQEKRTRMTYKIGYPDVWRDYSAVTIDERDLMGNVRSARAFEHRRNLAKLGGPIDRTEWGMTPQTVNAYHNPTMNEIVFPAAILQPPFFDLEADDAVNYGAIGAVIGHEISHAFDDQGRRFDANGNLSDWWTEEDAATYSANAQRLVEQFSAYEPLEGLHVNGQLTLGENIGDFTGIAIAWRAYQTSLNGAPAPTIDGLTGAERFFIGFGQIWRQKARDEALRQRLVSDPHSPPEYRLSGTLRNMDEFHETFKVSAGDAMWMAPEDRITIW